MRPPRVLVSRHILPALNLSRCPSIGALEGRRGPSARDFFQDSSVLLLLYITSREAIYSEWKGGMEKTTEATEAAGPGDP